ncbi:hypothetical protein JCM4814A_22220 [Streptomyces phaeofaciens JCM 4814]|uniref:Uncharacterized protein n=1 Tax=Streptomyces phaeofaciens TaxID=68254 RepID=A0A918H2U5_9ACTN|nr:hypothetical protein GCM10010226_07570 [Streptomyces phaeofaciens]
MEQVCPPGAPEPRRPPLRCRDGFAGGSTVRVAVAVAVTVAKPRGVAALVIQGARAARAHRAAEAGEAAPGPRYRPTR